MASIHLVQRSAVHLARCRPCGFMQNKAVRAISGQRLHGTVSTTTMSSPLTLPAHQLSYPTKSRPMPVSHDNGFVSLVTELTHLLGRNRGISRGTSDASVNVGALQKILQSYLSRNSDWRRYALADSSYPYTRNLVSTINNHANLLVLVWNPGQASPVHDHSGSHCLMKVLKGELRETLYAWPCETAAAASIFNPACEDPTHTCANSSDPLQSRALQIRRDTTYTRDQVTYMSDKLGLHRISNPSPTELAVSLHLYTPPNAAKTGCHVFNPKTGVRKHIAKCGFHSVDGVKVE